MQGRVEENAGVVSGIVETGIGDYKIEYSKRVRDLVVRRKALGSFLMEVYNIEDVVIDDDGTLLFRDSVFHGGSFSNVQEQLDQLCIYASNDAERVLESCNIVSNDSSRHKLELHLDFDGENLGDFKVDSDDGLIRGMFRGSVEFEVNNWAIYFEDDEVLDIDMKSHDMDGFRSVQDVYGYLLDVLDSYVDIDIERKFY